MSIAALPRPVLLGIVGVVLVGSVFFLTHKPSSTSSSTPAPAQTPPAAEAPTAKPGSASTAEPNKGTDAVTPATRSQTGAAGRGLPVKVKRALDAHKVVAILFWNPRGVDDRSVKASLSHVPRRHGKVAVFFDRVKHLSRYTRITAAASVTQTPSLVVVNPKGQAEVVTGYLDRQTVGQYVLNSLHR